MIEISITMISYYQWMMLCKEKLQKQQNEEVFALNIIWSLFQEFFKFFICLLGTSFPQIYAGAIFHLLFLIRASLVILLTHLSSSLVYMGPGYGHVSELW